MEYLLITLSALLISFISFYSGFGLGTVLMPIIAIFFPLPLAIFLTAIVHFTHNLLKTSLVWKSINWKDAVYFGIPSLIAAAIGAWLLTELAALSPIKEYTIFSIPAKFSILHFVVGVLLIVIASIEVLPIPKFKVKNLIFGGLLSGFFGGFSGHQGAFRSIFLTHANLSTKAFIATTAVISIGVDFVRLMIYGFSFSSMLAEIHPLLLFSAVGGGITGVVLGLALIHKVTIGMIQQLIVFLLFVLGALLAVGII